MITRGFFTFLFITLLVLPASADKFFPDDPLLQDPDCLPVGALEEVEYSKTMNLLVNTFGDPGDETPRSAVNTNTLGEVPNSSWFTNRIGQNPMTKEELLRGSNTGSGPDPTQFWSIINAKFEGITPGFVIEDSRGDKYFIKFDTKGYPQMATSAETISTKFFHAFGYHVPENYLVFVDRKNLAMHPDAIMIVDKTTRRNMTQEDVDHMFERIAILPDGRVPAVASKMIPGDVLGTFLFHGTRTDDPNDIFPHEDRRELRGLRVFAAWLNHDELQTFNTLDSKVEQDGSACVKHFLLDFNSTFGSANIRPQDPRSGNEYYYETGPSLKAAYTIGLWDRPWRHVEYPDYPSIGKFEADFFQPENWKPDYPNTAFNKMQNDDAFWATKIVNQFGDDQIRALVGTGQYVDQEAAQYLIQTLIKRRDKIVRYYFSQLNPLDSFSISGGSELQFVNLGLNAKIAPSASYKYQWFRFDNMQLSTEPLTSGISTSPSIPVPNDAAEYLMVRIQTVNSSIHQWEKAVDVFLRNATKTIVGIDREN